MALDIFKSCDTMNGICSVWRGSCQRGSYNRYLWPGRGVGSINKLSTWTGVCSAPSNVERWGRNTTVNKNHQKQKSDVATTTTTTTAIHSCAARDALLIFQSPWREAQLLHVSRAHTHTAAHLQMADARCLCFFFPLASWEPALLRQFLL